MEPKTPRKPWEVREEEWYRYVVKRQKLQKAVARHVEGVLDDDLAAALQEEQQAYDALHKAIGDLAEDDDLNR